MPIKSKAQRRKFAELLVDGKISEEVYERWNRGAGYKELPERVTPKDKKSKGNKKITSRPKAKRKASSRTTSKTKKRSTSTRKAGKPSTRTR